MFGAAVLALLLLPAAYLLTNRQSRSDEDLNQVVKRYLKAAYARDFNQAYRYISAEDRRLKEEKIYVRERGPFTGFTLEVAKKLAEWIEAVPVEREIAGSRTRIKMNLRLPDANGLSELVLGWDEDRLNELSDTERAALVGQLKERYEAGKIRFIEGQESFALVREGSGWRLFLNWAAGIRVSFGASVPPGANIEVTPVPREVVTQSGELFTIAYRVKNRARQEISARIRHRVSPIELGQHLDLVDCALIIPVALAPGASEEYSSTYVVRGDFPDGQRQLFVTYEFEVTER